MPPVRSYSNWNQRPTDYQEQIEPYQKFFFICEGANTEVFYFKKLVDLRKQLGIHPLIDIRLLEKTGEDMNLSNPKRLLAFAEEQKKDPHVSFDKERDKMIVVIDADIFSKKPKEYAQLLESADRSGNILAVTNPAFELFLLLHYENSYETDVIPNKIKILNNPKEGKRRFIEKLFSQKSKMNSKTNSKIGELAKNIDIAIAQERKINEDIQECIGKITCNVGKVIADIRDSKPSNL